MKAAAFNTGSDTHLLDHIAPLAILAEIPLVVTEEKNWEFAKHYYPQVEVRYQPDLEFELEAIADEFDLLIECKYWKPQLKLTFRELYKKEMKLIFCPHGQSDKGFHAPLLRQYAFQEAVLIYGERMMQMLQQLGLWSQITSYARVGNYRFAFYEKTKAFYDSLAEKEIFSFFPKQNPTLLYAPTWNDADGATTFFTQTDALLSSLPLEWNLLIKVHPLLEERDPGLFYPMAYRVEKRPNTQLLLDFPPIYPILARVDAYLGDFSSVGYDFLKFQKPMYFFTKDHLGGGRLHECGKIVTEMSSLSLENPFAAKQADLYKSAFDENTCVKQKIRELLESEVSFPEPKNPVSSFFPSLWMSFFAIQVLI